MPRSTLRFRMNTKLRTRVKKAARKSGMTPERLVATAIQRYVDLKDAEGEFENTDFYKEQF